LGHDSTPPVSSRVREAWRSARAFARMSRQKYRFGERQTLRTDGFPEACVGWRCYRLTAAPPAGRSGDVPIPGTTWVSPPVLHPGRPTLRRSPEPVRPPCLRSEIPLHPLPPPLRIAGRASLPCDGTEGSMAAGLPMAGWGRCNFWKMSEVRGLVARDMLTIGGWGAYSFHLTLREKGPLCDQQRGAAFDPKPPHGLGGRGVTRDA
jgi:hypothetical protein